jgi:hypothetical protein
MSEGPGTIFDSVPDGPAEGDVIYTSASQLGSFMRCAFQFYGVHILKYKDPINSNLHFGVMFDETLNYNYGEKKTSEKDLPKSTLQDFFRTTWDAKKDSVMEWDGDPKDLKEMGTKGIGIFYDEVMPGVQPAEVQPKLSLTFKNENVILRGRPDVVEVPSKGDQIIDNKTAAQSKPESFIRQSLQPVLYSIMTGDGSTKDREVRLDILVKTKSPKYQPLKMLVTEAHRQAALKTIKNTLDLIELQKKAKNFPPTAFYRAGWECGYCAVRELCKSVWGLDVPESAIAKKEAKAKLKAIGPASADVEKAAIEKAAKMWAKDDHVPNVIEQLKDIEDAAKKKPIDPDDEKHREITL